MFDVNLIKQELKGLVGFRQPINPKFAIVDATNQLSKSGLFVTDNTYAKIEYIKANIDYARADNTQFNQILTNIKETSATSICSQVFIDDDFIDRNLIYTQTQNKIEEIDLPIGFVGYRINIDENKNVAIRINRAIFEFVDDKEFDLLVFNSNIKEPVETVTISSTSFYKAETLDIMLNNIGFYKGSFFIGFVNDGTFKTYRKNYLDSIHRNTIKHTCIVPIIVSNYTGTDLFDLNEARETSEYSGFNLDITIVDDYTDFIITNKFLFARAMYLDCIISCLNIYASSLRSNSDERNAEELYRKIMVEVEGTRPDDNVITIRGLRPQIIYEISQIREQLLKLRGGFFGKGYFVETQN